MFNPKEPLWLPPGSVRAIISLVLVVPLAVIFLRSAIVISADQAIGVVTIVLAAYFIQKSAAKPPNGAP